MTTDINKAWLKKAVCRARSQSKRWHRVHEIHHCIKGRGKGNISAVEKGDWSHLWTGSVTEVLAVYKEGVRIYEKAGKRARLKVW